MLQFTYIFYLEMKNVMLNLELNIAEWHAKVCEMNTVQVKNYIE